MLFDVSPTCRAPKFIGLGNSRMLMPGWEFVTASPCNVTVGSPEIAGLVPTAIVAVRKPLAPAVGSKVTLT